MVKALLSLGKREDRVVNIVKGMHSLRNKSDAVKYIIDRYEEEFLEPPLRPSFIKKMKRLEKEKTIRFKDLNELRALIGR